jgi:hypothetical protein
MMTSPPGPLSRRERGSLCGNLICKKNFVVNGLRSITHEEILYILVIIKINM